MRKGWNLAVRVLIALIFGPLLLWIFWHGELVLAGFCAFLASGLIWEFSGIVPIRFGVFQTGTLIITGFGTVALAHFGLDRYIPAFIAVFFIVFAALDVRREIDSTLMHLGVGAFAVVYFGVPVALVIGIRDVSPWYAIYILALVWTVDTFAYFTGLLIGKHSFSPRLSPHKTVEGAFGAIIGGLAISLLFHYLAPEKFGLLWSLGLGIYGGIASQIGDLIESKVKREIGIKDSGRFIPGHGGLWDRFDSFLFVTPIIYILVRLVGIAG